MLCPVSKQDGGMGHTWFSFELLLIYDEDLGERGVYGDLEPGSYHYPPDLERLSLLIVKMSFLEFTKKKKKTQKYLQGKMKVSRLVWESLGDVPKV